MGGLRAWARAPVGAGVVFVVLLGMVSLGLRVPGFGWLAPFGGRFGPSIGAPPTGEFLPLRDSFVESVLGALPSAAVNEAADPSGDRPTAFATPRDLGPQIVEHPLTNDEPDSAYEIERVPFTARSDTSEAESLRSDDPSDCAPVGKTVYYRYAPHANGGLVATTASGEPVSLAVYPERATPASRASACDADPQGRAKVSLPGVAGVTYLFQITMPVGGPLVFSLDREATTSLITGDDLGAYGIEWRNGLADVSGNGRYITFASENPRLFESPCPCSTQIFVRDLVTGKTELVSATSTGGVPNDQSGMGGISADGRYVVFDTWANNVVPGDAGVEGDVFVRDRLLGRTERITIAEDGTELAGQWPSMSADGRYVAFTGDWDGRLNPYWDHDPTVGWVVKDVYVKDRVSGEIVRISDGVNGTRGNHDSQTPIISPDGRYVSFWSRASNLLTGRAATLQHAWNQAELWRGYLHVYDMKTGSRTVECVDEAGEPADAGCYGPRLSWGGRYSIFWSPARNLLPGHPPEKDTGALTFLYRRDRLTGELDIVNTTEDGVPVGEPYTEKPKGLFLVGRDIATSISWDGGIVAFDSAGELIGGDENDLADIYIKDYGNAERMTRISVGLAGSEPNGSSQFATLSADASVVSFVSFATNLTPEDANGQADAFVAFWRVP